MAPPRKQADNRENKHFPAALGGFCLLEKLYGWEAGMLERIEAEKARQSEGGSGRGYGAGASVGC